MKLSRSLIVLASLTAAFATTAAAQATQDVTYAVSAINQISVSGGAQTLTVNTASAGSAPNSVASTGVTWAITTNETNKMITAQLDAPMASGVTLKADLAAPTVGTSAGAVVLDNTSAQSVVTAIDNAEQSGLSLVYTLNATTAAGVVAAATVTVTYTIADGV